MKFVNPVNAPASNVRVPYWDANRTAGLIGAIPPAKLVNDLQDEILKVITQAGLTPDPADPTQLWQALSLLLAQVVAGVSPPITVAPGIIAMHGATTPPAGWLKCNGQAVSRTAFAPLFTAIGTTWGAGDAVTTFNVPDFRGEFVRGFDDTRGIDAGRAFGSFQDWATAAPKTTTPSRVNGAGATIGMTNASNPSKVGFARPSKTGESVTSQGYDSGGSGTELDGLNVVTGDAETRPRNLAAMFIIKT
jgi:microcystin-dependent protein